MSVRRIVGLVVGTLLALSCFMAVVQGHVGYTGSLTVIAGDNFNRAQPLVIQLEGDKQVFQPRGEWTQKGESWLTLLCQAVDVSTVPRSQVYYAGLTGPVQPGTGWWFTTVASYMPSGSCTLEHQKVLEECISAHGIDLVGYTGVDLFFNFDTGCSWGGFAVYEGELYGVIWMGAQHFDQAAHVHERGHTLTGGTIRATCGPTGLVTPPGTLWLFPGGRCITPFAGGWRRER